MNKFFLIIALALNNLTPSFSQTPSIKDIDNARREILKEYVDTPTEVYLLFDSIEIRVKKVIFNGIELLLTDNSSNSPNTKLFGMFVNTKTQIIFVSGDIWDESALSSFYEIAFFSKDWKEIRIHWVRDGIVTNQILLDKLFVGDQSFDSKVFHLKKGPCKRRLKIDNLPIDQIVDFNPIKKRSQLVFRMIITKLDVFAILTGEYPAELDY